MHRSKKASSFDPLVDAGEKHSDEFMMYVNRHGGTPGTRNYPSSVSPKKPTNALP
jgi:hypothetical protein